MTRRAGSSPARVVEKRWRVRGPYLGRLSAVALVSMLPNRKWPLEEVSPPSSIELPPSLLLSWRVSVSVFCLCLCIRVSIDLCLPVCECVRVRHGGITHQVHSNPNPQPSTLNSNPYARNPTPETAGQQAASGTHAAPHTVSHTHAEPYEWLTCTRRRQVTVTCCRNLRRYVFSYGAEVPAKMGAEAKRGGAGSGALQQAPVEPPILRLWAAVRARDGCQCWRAACGGVTGYESRGQGSARAAEARKAGRQAKGPGGKSAAGKAVTVE